MVFGCHGYEVPIGRLIGLLCLLPSKGPTISVTIVALARACSTAALRHKDIISDLSPVFDSIPELCTASGPSTPDQGGRGCPKDVFCQVGAVLVKLCAPSWIHTLGPTRIRPTALHAWDLSSSWFPHQTHFEPMAGRVISPAMVLPLSRDDHVNNHLFIGDQPPTTVNTPLCQDEAIPRKPEGIEPFTHGQHCRCVKSRPSLANQKV